MAIFDLWLSRNNGATLENYVGHKDRLFYDENEKVLRYSDGSTVGGFVINPITTTVSNTEPTNVPEGAFWLNPTSYELWCYYNGEFIPTIDIATETKIGGIKLGPGVIVNAEGQLLIDTAGLEFAFGDFYAFTNPGASNGACLSSINPNQDINIVSNGTGGIHVIGNFDVHKTNEDVEGALQTEPIFSITNDGNIRVLAPNAGGIGGAVQIVGNETGSVVSPNQTGVVVHITGNQDMVSRNYIDGVNNYSLLVGRRYNGTAASSVNVKNGELFFRIAGQASTGTSFETFGPAQIDWVATENQGPNNQGGELRIRATPNGSSAASGIVQVAAFNATTGVTSTQGFNGPLTGQVTVAAGTTSAYPLKFTSGTNLTTPQSGAMEYNGTVFYATPVDQERGLVVTEQKYILNDDRLLNNNLVSQSLFGAGFHATGGVRYRYQILCTVTKTGGNSVSIGYGLAVNGGGALARHTYRVSTTIGATATTPTPVYAMRNSVTTNFATPVDVTGPLTNGASGSTFDIQGIIEVTTSGYVTPQVTFLANAPTGATLSANATIRVFPVGATGANTVIGNWV